MVKAENKLSSILETNLVQEIMKTGKTVNFKEGDVIIDYDKHIKSMPIILSGTVRVMKRDETGREILLYYLSSNDSCAMAYTCCMEARRSEIKAIAEDNVEIITVPHEKLDEWLVKYPTWKSYIFNSFTQRFNELLKSLESVAFQKLDERLVNYLKNKTKVSGKKVVSLSHQQIADELGTSRVVVSRLLKQLENDKKVILYRNELKILNTL
ncbi:MAG: Crp/Fnr family transcriptional regulator [Sphingobacteriales bacterium]|jgi:CRP/FNR family transcriptional regulator|nr:Crp/Fnr family transcriptional regulator [Sphingobacteriales bacterium]